MGIFSKANFKHNAKIKVTVIKITNQKAQAYLSVVKFHKDCKKDTAEEARKPRIKTIVEYMRTLRYL